MAMGCLIGAPKAATSNARVRGVIALSNRHVGGWSLHRASIRNLGNALVPALNRHDADINLNKHATLVAEHRRER